MKPQAQACGFFLSLLFRSLAYAAGSSPGGAMKPQAQACGFFLPLLIAVPFVWSCQFS